MCVCVWVLDVACGANKRGRGGGRSLKEDMREVATCLTCLAVVGKGVACLVVGHVVGASAVGYGQALHQHQVSFCHHFAPRALLLLLLTAVAAVALHAVDELATAGPCEGCEGEAPLQGTWRP